MIKGLTPEYSDRLKRLIEDKIKPHELQNR